MRHLSLRVKTFLALFFFTAITAITIGVLTFYQFQQIDEISHQNRLLRKEKNITEAIDYLITDTPDTITEKNIGELLENKIFELYDINGIHINLFDLSGRLLLSSEAKISEEVEKIPQKIMARLNSENDHLQIKRTEGSDTYLTSYSYIYNINRDPIAILNLPYKHDDSFIKSEFYTLLERFLGVISLVLIIGTGVSWWVSKSLTSQINRIAGRLQQTQVVAQNKRIEYSRNDELKTIVDSYNMMIDKLNDQSKQLLKNEREETWREAARQVAHEIKNPLTPMRLQIQSFQRKFDPKREDIDERVNEFSKGLIVQIDNLSKIATAFSDFTKMPVRKDEIIDLIGGIETAIEVFDSNVVRLNADRESINIHFDPNYLVRVITNLVKNAIQAIPRGRKPEVLIKVTTESQLVSINIIDNGNGIPDSIKDRLFEPKFTTKSSGSGLGLAMVKKIIEEYNGSISFKNNTYQGATFIVNLPLSSTLK